MYLLNILIPEKKFISTDELYIIVLVDIWIGIQLIQ